MREPLDIQALQARGLPRLRWDEVMTIHEGELTADETQAIRDYFARFLKPDEHNKCVGCGARLTGGIEAWILGATFEWTIQHGEGHCRDCGYPARAIHYDVGPIKQLRAVLQYHPDELTARTPETATPGGR